jgi:hypothetical protein
MPASESTSPTALSVTTRIREATERLSAEFQRYYTQQDVERTAQEWLAAYEGAPVVEFLPLLVERFTREQLVAKLHGHAAAR